MLLAPRPGFQYRDTVTKQLVPEAGMELDPADFDVHRALECGDLVEVKVNSKSKPASPAE